jgi:malonyl-CoA O-methyltransferase
VKEKNIVNTRDGYDLWAKIYDREDNALIALEELYLNKLIEDLHGLNVLELGSGTGRITTRLIAGKNDVTAIDFSSEMTKVAQSKPEWHRVKFIAADLNCRLPLPENFFDAVISALVIDHIKNLPVFFSECKRICRPDGRILISVLHPAMMLLGINARFTDPDTGLEIFPESFGNQISDYVNAIAEAGIKFVKMFEYSVDQKVMEKSPKAAKYKGWPLLLMFELRA